MKQLGNLAIICAQRPEILLQVQKGEATVHVGEGPNRTALRCAWDDDRKISEIIYELNFGEHRRKGGTAR